MKRRSFLEVMGVAAGSLVAGSARASTPHEDDPDRVGVLVDLTECAGCRGCEFACAEANGLPTPAEDVDLETSGPRSTSTDQWVAVSRYDTSQGEVFVRRQCMHCESPACAAACLTKALYKTEEGPVIWREDKCMGCRFCMISCPFDVPKFEFDRQVPDIQKCRLCFERLQEGQRPACVEECPAEALTFGKRSELLEIARERIYQNPGRYVSHIYGEHEVGGTGFLYLSPVPFEELGFRTDLGDDAYPEYTRDFLTAVPVVLALWPAFLLGIRRNHRTEPALDAGEDPSTES